MLHGNAAARLHGGYRKAGKNTIEGKDLQQAKNLAFLLLFEKLLALNRKALQAY